MVDFNVRSLFSAAKAAVAPPAPRPAEPTAPPPPNLANLPLDRAVNKLMANPAALKIPTSTTQAKELAAEIWAGPEPGSYNPIKAPGVDTSKDLQAVNQVEANKALEQDRLSGMPPDEQKRYHDLKVMFDEDPQAELALQTALFSGKLADKNSAGETTLQALTKLSTQEAAPPAHRSQLAAEVVRHIAEPGTISQGKTNCCAAASLQVTMATNQPAEYARLVAGLAKKDGGEVTLQGKADGKPVVAKRIPNWEVQEVVKNEQTGKLELANPQRTMTDRLFQNSMMDAGAKIGRPNASYDPTIPGVRRPGEQPEIDMAGLEYKSAGPLAQAMQSSGGDFQPRNINGVQDLLLQDVDKKMPLTVELNTSFNKETGDPEGETIKGRITRKTSDGRYVFERPGHEPQLMTEKELANRVVSKGLSDAKNETFQALASRVDGQGKPTTAMIRVGDFDEEHGLTTDKATKTVEGYHYVTVTKIDQNAHTVTIKDTQSGKQRTMSETEFKNRLSNASIPV
jgi:hypothetical protein